MRDTNAPGPEAHLTGRISRDLSPADVMLQAEAFLDWYRRAGLSVGLAFDRWCASKSLSPADSKAIWREVQRLRVASPQGDHA